MNIHLGITDNDLVDLKQRIDKASGMAPFGVEAKLAVPVGLLKCLVAEYEDGLDVTDERDDLSGEVGELKEDAADADRLEEENAELRKRVDALEDRLRELDVDPQSVA